MGYNAYQDWTNGPFAGIQVLDSIGNFIISKQKFLHGT